MSLVCVMGTSQLAPGCGRHCSCAGVSTGQGWSTCTVDTSLERPYAAHTLDATKQVKTGWLPLPHPLCWAVQLEHKTAASVTAQQQRNFFCPVAPAPPLLRPHCLSPSCWLPSCTFLSPCSCTQQQKTGPGFHLSPTSFQQLRLTAENSLKYGNRRCRYPCCGEGPGGGGGGGELPKGRGGWLQAS